jgi:hypothetical protein
LLRALSHSTTTNATTMTTTMSPQDLQICNEIHAGLTSKERNNINYLFLEPVDVTTYHDYLSIISHPMDLRTLKENLDNGMYATKEGFCDDAALIFENAILYNKGSRDSQFVLKLAESMTKALERLRRNAEKRVARQFGTKPAASTKGGKGGGSGGDTRKANTEVVAVAAVVGEGKLKSKKISIKLKRKTVTSEKTNVATSTTAEGGNNDVKQSEASAVVDADNPKPTKKAKTKLRLSASSIGKSVSDVRGEESPSNNVKITKIKHASGKSSSFVSTPMNAARRAQCCKVLASLKRRQATACRHFHKPVSDSAIVKNYKERVLNPMDLSTISSRQVQP